MKALIRNKDVATAEKFFANSGPLKPLFERFPEATETEFLEDWVKLGCYLTYRQQGIDHPLAAMQACRRGPQMGNSDRTFNQKARRRMDLIPSDQMKVLLKMAHQAGIATQGKFYCSGLADRRGARDPKAWVSTTSEVLAVARERNLEVRGAVRHKADEVAPAPKVPLAPDIVDDLVRARLTKDEELRAKVVERPARLSDLRADVIASHGRK